MDVRWLGEVWTFLAMLLFTLISLVGFCAIMMLAWWKAKELYYVIRKYGTIPMNDTIQRTQKALTQ